MLLVGGSSRIPLVAQLVSDGLGRPVAVDTDPKNAIAKGAALSVSPMPTASWPEVAIPLVAAADQTTVVLPTEAPAEHAGKEAPKAAPAPVAAAALAPVAVRPPVRKPAVAGPVALFGADGGRHASGLADQPDAAPNRPVVPGGEAVEGWEPEPEKRTRKPVGLLVGVGGLLAVAAIILTALLVPKLAAATSPGIVTESGTSAPTTSVTAPAAAPAPARWRWRPTPGVRARRVRGPSPLPALRRWPRRQPARGAQPARHHARSARADHRAPSRRPVNRCASSRHHGARPDHRYDHCRRGRTGYAVARRRRDDRGHPGGHGLQRRHRHPRRHRLGERRRRHPRGHGLGRQRDARRHRQQRREHFRGRPDGGHPDGVGLSRRSADAPGPSRTSAARTGMLA